MAKAIVINRVAPGRVKEVIEISKSAETRVFTKPFGRNIGALLAGRAAPHKHATAGMRYDTENYTASTWREAPVEKKNELAKKKIEAVKSALESAGFKKGAERIGKRLETFVEEWVPKVRETEEKKRTGVVAATYHGVPMIIPRPAFLIAKMGKDADAWVEIASAPTRLELEQKLIEMGRADFVRKVRAPEAIPTIVVTA